MRMSNGERLVYVVTRLDGEEDNHIIGVWDEKRDIIPALRNEFSHPEFDWCREVHIRGSWIIGKDKKCESKIGYITRCRVQ